MCDRLPHSLRRCPGLVALTLGVCLAGCESATAPPPSSAYSLVGDYVLTWGFLMADAGTFLNATGSLDLTKIHGTINCPGEFMVTRQTAAGISGTFRAMSGYVRLLQSAGRFLRLGRRAVLLPLCRGQLVWRLFPGRIAGDHGGGAVLQYE